MKRVLFDWECVVSADYHGLRDDSAETGSAERPFTEIVGP